MKLSLTGGGGTAVLGHEHRAEGISKGRVLSHLSRTTARLRQSRELRLIMRSSAQCRQNPAFMAACSHTTVWESNIPHLSFVLDWRLWNEVRVARQDQRKYSNSKYQCVEEC